MGAMMDALPTLETPRLSLRPMTPEDAQNVVRWRNSHHVKRMMAAERDAPLTIEEHLEWFDRTRANRIDYVIELRAIGRPIGTVSLDWRASPQGARCAESGRILGVADLQGQGYSKEAASCWMDFAFTQLLLDCVFARTRADNRANIAIGQALGFKRRAWPEWLERPEGSWVFTVLTKQMWDVRTGS